MKITGRRIVLRDDPRPGDSEDLFRWLNLAEWNYYDEPDIAIGEMLQESCHNL
jgi:hypothetical protein